MLIEATSYFPAFVAGHSCVSSKTCSLSVKQPYILRQTSNSSFLVDHISCLTRRRCSSQVENLWKLSGACRCVTEIEKREREWMARHRWFQFTQSKNWCQHLIIRSADLSDLRSVIWEWWASYKYTFFSVALSVILDSTRHVGASSSDNFSDLFGSTKKFGRSGVRAGNWYDSLTMWYISEYACWKITVMSHLHFWCMHVQIYLGFQVVGVSEQANWTWCLLYFMAWCFFRPFASTCSGTAAGNKQLKQEKCCNARCPRSNELQLHEHTDVSQ